MVVRSLPFGALVWLHVLWCALFSSRECRSSSLPPAPMLLELSGPCHPECGQNGLIIWFENCNSFGHCPVVEGCSVAKSSQVEMMYVCSTRNCIKRHDENVTRIEEVAVNVCYAFAPVQNFCRYAVDSFDPSAAELQCTTKDLQREDM